MCPCDVADTCVLCVAVRRSGAVQIRNWKPLSFGAITDSRSATVQEILGDLSSVATLRIKLSRCALARSSLLAPHWLLARHVCVCVSSVSVSRVCARAR